MQASAKARVAVFVVKNWRIWGAAMAVSYLEAADALGHGLLVLEFEQRRGKACEALTECCTLNSASHQTARLCF